MRTTYTYDDAGRIDQRRYPDGSRITWSYDPVGNPLVIASPYGRYTRTYDPVYHVTRLVHPTSEVFTWSYDAVGQYRFRADPDAGRTTFTYGPTGRLAHLLVNADDSLATIGTW